MLPRIFADCCRAISELESEMKKLSRESFNYPAKDLYYHDLEGPHLAWVNIARSHVIRSLKTYLESRNKVPSIFLFPSKTTCKRSTLIKIGKIGDKSK